MLEASNSNGVLLVFLTITHHETTEVIRLVLDNEDFELGGELFNKSWFTITMLPDNERPPEATLSFPNVNRRAMNMIRHVNGPARVMFEIYSSRFFDTTVAPRVPVPGPAPTRMYRAKGLYLTNVSVSPSEVSATLRSWDYRTERWPEKTGTQALLPGVYVR